jgi:hypothetical protein
MLVLAALLGAGCGSSSGGKASSASSTSTTATSAPATPLTAPPSGSYSATMTTKGLESAGVIVRDVGNAGTWHLTLSKKKLTLKAPYKDAFGYPVVAVTKDKLTLGPEPECSTAKGRSQKSIYTESQSAGGLLFKAVHFACPEDGGVITAGIWKKG